MLRMIVVLTALKRRPIWVASVGGAGPYNNKKLTKIPLRIVYSTCQLPFALFMDD